VTCLESFLKFSSFSLFTFDFFSPLLLLRQSRGGILTEGVAIETYLKLPELLGLLFFLLMFRLPPLRFL